MNPLLLLAIKEAPGIIRAFRALFVQQHPDEPVPDEATILAAFNDAYETSKAKSERWLADHPA